MESTIVNSFVNAVADHGFLLSSISTRYVWLKMAGAVRVPSAEKVSLLKAHVYKGTSVERLR